MTCELLNNDKDNHRFSLGCGARRFDDFDGAIKITSDQYAKIEEMIHVFSKDWW